MVKKEEEAKRWSRWMRIRGWRREKGGGAVGVEGGLDTVVGVGRAKTRNDALNQYVRH